MLTPRTSAAECARRSFSRQNGRIVNWFGLLTNLFPGIISDDSEDTDAVTLLLRSCVFYYSYLDVLSEFRHPVCVVLLLQSDPSTDADN